jgi:hypothetical protein
LLKHETTLKILEVPVCYPMAYCLSFIALSTRNKTDNWTEIYIDIFSMLRMRWVGNVGRMERGEVSTGFWWINLREGGHFEDQA